MITFFSKFSKLNMHKIIVSQRYSSVLLTLSKDILLYLIIKSIIKGKFRNQIKFSHCTRSLTITLIEFLIFVVILLIQILDTSFDLHYPYYVYLFYYIGILFYGWCILVSICILFPAWYILSFEVVYCLFALDMAVTGKNFFFVSYQSNLNITPLRNIVKYFV